MQPGTGSLIRFMADVEGRHPVQIRGRLLDMVEPTPSEEFEDALRMAFESKPTVEEPPIFIKLPQQFLPLREGGSRMAKAYLKFAQDRGLNLWDLENWNVRFCPVLPPSMQQAINHWKGRIIFPIYDREGKLRSAVGRALPSKIVRTPWVNWPESDIGSLLWPLGYFSGTKWVECSMFSMSHAVLVEGIFDAMAVLDSCGSELAFRTFCTFGKKISDSQIELLHELGITGITLAWDKDAKTEIQAAATKLSEGFDEILVFPFNSPKWEECDLGDVLRGRVPPELIEEELNAAVDVQSSEYVAWQFQ